MADNRPIVYRENGKVYYRASGFGNCIRALTAARMGMDPASPPANLMKAFKAGHAREKSILNAFVELYYDLSGFQRVVEWEPVPGNVIRGSVDAVAIVDDTPFAVVDAKYLGKQYFNQFYKYGAEGMGHLGQKYLLQGYMYMKGLNDPNVKTFILFAEDKSEKGTYWEVEYEMGQIEELLGIDEQWVIDRIKLIERNALNSDLTDLSDCKLSYGCPYYWLHEDNMTNMFLNEDGLNESEHAIVAELAKKYKMAAKAEKDAIEAKKEAQAILGSYLDKLSAMPEKLDETTKDQVKAKINTNYATISRYQSKRTSVDTKAMKLDGIDTTPYESTTYFPVVRITEKKRNED